MNRIAKKMLNKQHISPKLQQEIFKELNNLQLYHEIAVAEIKRLEGILKKNNISIYQTREP